MTLEHEIAALRRLRDRHRPPEAPIRRVFTWDILAKRDAQGQIFHYAREGYAVADSHPGAAAVGSSDLGEVLMCPGYVVHWEDSPRTCAFSDPDGQLLRQPYYRGVIDRDPNFSGPPGILLATPLPRIHACYEV